jgi:hypothetical protein
VTLEPAAWVALGCLAAIILFSGLVLWGAWRRGLGASRHSPMPPPPEGPSFTRAWEKEDAQFGELSRRVKDLDQAAPPKESPPSQKGS